MAKTSAKTVTAPVKKTAAKPKAKTPLNIETVAEDILAKLKSLDLEQQLQADLNWCLGSYRYDHNATGLVEVMGMAHDVLKQALAQKTKGITTAFLNNIQKVLN